MQQGGGDISEKVTSEQSCSGVTCSWGTVLLSFFLVVLSFELRALLAGKVLYHLNHASSPWGMAFRAKETVGFKVSIGCRKQRGPGGPCRAEGT
jgi:hypothetical protein